MGVFAFYCGFIYNDFFSLPLKLFGTCFENVEGSAVTELVPDCVHPLGLDPKWYIAKNELSFMNSLKMKMAVIVGVLQMLVGICLKGLNCLSGGHYLDFIFEFIP
jgi:V-type H+-transporting ATPase subunit a